VLRLKERLQLIDTLCLIHPEDSFSLRFNDHSPGETGLAGVYWSKG